MDGNHFSLQPQQHSVSIAKFFKSSRWIGAPVSAKREETNAASGWDRELRILWENDRYWLQLENTVTTTNKWDDIPVQTFSISVVQTLYAMSITPNDVIDPCSMWFIHHHLSLYRYVWPRLAIVFSPSANIKAKVTNQSEGTRLKTD